MCHASSLVSQETMGCADAAYGKLHGTEPPTLEAAERRTGGAVAHVFLVAGKPRETAVHWHLVLVVGHCAAAAVSRLVLTHRREVVVRLGAGKVEPREGLREPGA